MKKLFELGNRYAAKSDWKDFALTKFCLFSMGLLIGSFLPEKAKRPARITAGSIFAASYSVLMKKIILIIKEMRSES